MIIDQASTSYPVNLTNILSKLNLDNYSRIFKKILRNYQDTKKKQNLVDFNDLMVLFANFLKTKKSEQFLSEIEYIFFDDNTLALITRFLYLQSLASSSLLTSSLFAF